MAGLFGRFEFLKADECILTDVAKDGRDMLITALSRVRFGIIHNNCSVSLRTKNPAVTSDHIVAAINQVSIEEFNERNTYNGLRMWQHKELIPMMMQTSLFDTTFGLLLISPIADFHVATFGQNHKKWKSHPEARIQVTMADAETNPVIRETNLTVHECVFTAAVLQQPVMNVAGFCRLTIPESIMAKISINTQMEEFTVDNAREAISQISIQEFKSCWAKYETFNTEERSIAMLANNWFDTSFGVVNIATLDTRDITAFGDHTKWRNRPNLHTRFHKSEAFKL